MSHRNHSDLQENWRWHKVGTWIAISLLAYFLITEHQAHVIQALPYLLLLACPLMHVFMHKGHSHKRDPHESKKEKES